MRPKRAMVLAAGYGLRMRPLTDKTPKPLLPVQGRSLLERILDRLAEAGVEEAVINLHHLGEQIEQRLSDRKKPKIRFSWEREEVLETGGGVAKALPLLGDEPFFVINGDVLWLNGYQQALHRLADAWDARQMDALLLVHSTPYAVGYEGKGDFFLAADGRLLRRSPEEVAPFVFAGIQILHPRLFEGAPEGPFSLNRIYDRAAESETLFGLRHDGEWFHIGTPGSLKETEELFDSRDFPIVLR
ncbi:nucleotidyltransferase family protein [Limibacillus halophilus]|uniref:MurNAc alpha-1-phosphate uridylyltransferase n=1 Tax=Limibacillus halophilus TaxID=1579333 RepID=A0A839SRN4_9PROT|nr:nucleotidyltransferase family protein [Limibacillus halophilus]MBB3064016.1 MurNAc alpha-1-phosphate uridylyltransferase [Limibacillus halophilus]